MTNEGSVQQSTTSLAARKGGEHLNMAVAIARKHVSKSGSSVNKQVGNGHRKKASMPSGRTSSRRTLTPEQKKQGIRCDLKSITITSIVVIG